LIVTRRGRDGAAALATAVVVAADAVAVAA
jgi:hypothetical protein